MRLSWILVGLLVGWPAAAQLPRQPMIPPEALRSDLDILWKAAEQGDPAVDRYRSRATLARLFTEARRRINRPMNEFEFYRTVAPAVAAMGNGHASLALSTASMDWLTQQAPLLPLGVIIHNGHLYVVRDLSTEQAIQPGAEIVSINGVPASTLVRAAIASVVVDGTSSAPRESGASGWNFIYDLVRLHEMGPSYRLILATHGKRDSVEIAGMAGGAILRTWRARFPSDAQVAARDTASLRYAASRAVLTIPHWDYPEQGKPGLSESFARWFAELEQNKTPVLIIDIRNNGGGAEHIATELLSYLVARPFEYYRCASLRAASFDFFQYSPDSTELRRDLPGYVRPASARCLRHGALELSSSIMPNMGMQAPRLPHFAGRVYLLVNGATFSTSAEFASLFHQQRCGMIIGEETSGGYLGNSSGVEAALVLPASQLRFTATLVAFHLAVRRVPSRNGGVVPDIMVGKTIDDLISGRDVEMSVVERLEGRRGPGARRQKKGNVKRY